LEIIESYFSDFSDQQKQQFAQLFDLYKEWNEKINVISRRDIDSLYENHVLHSLGIASITDFDDGTKILDLGTGGGFPGIPLAIFFPEVEFTLVDRTKKKLKVVDAVSEALSLKNVKTIWSRVEDVDGQFDFVTCRAVAPLKQIWDWSKSKISKGSNRDLDNGLLCLKGGDLHMEISESGTSPMVWELGATFKEEYFKEKYVLYVRR